MAFHTPLHSTPPLRGFPSEYRHPVWHGKTRMACLPEGKKISKISLFVLAQLMNVTDRRTDRQTDGHCMPAIAALMHSIARQKLNITVSNCYVIVTFLCEKCPLLADTSLQSLVGMLTTEFCSGICAVLLGWVPAGQSIDLMLCSSTVFKICHFKSTRSV